MSILNVTVTNSAAAPTDKVSGVSLSVNRRYLIVHNPSKSGYLAFTFDGTTPAIETNGFTLFPGGTFVSDQYAMPGNMLMISSLASQSATIYWS